MQNKICLGCNKAAGKFGVGFICPDCRISERPIEIENTREIKRAVLTKENNIGARVTALNFFNVFDYVGNLGSLTKVAEQISDFLKKVEKPCVVSYEFGFSYLTSSCENFKTSPESFKSYQQHTQNINSGFFSSDIFKIIKDAEVKSSEKLFQSGMIFCGLAYLSFTIRPNKLATTPKLGGGKYNDLPAFFDKSNNIINVKNNDEKCFLWSLLANDYLTINKKPNGTKRGKFLIKI